MKKIKHFIIDITVIIVLIVNLVNCSNNPKTSEIKKEVVKMNSLIIPKAF